MTKIEAAKKLEEMTLSSSTDKNIVGFLKFYHNGGVHKAIESGKTLDQLFALAESKGVVFPEELKACMQAIFA
jgi:hypothetical protein